MGSHLDARAPSLGAGAAQLVAWTLLGAVDMVFIAALRGPVSPAVRAQHLFFDVGQLLAAGCFAAALVESWRHVVPGRKAWSIVALALGSIGLGALTLPLDLSNYAHRLTDGRGVNVVLGVLVVVLSSAVPAAALAGRLARGVAGRCACVAMAVAAAVVNNVVLRSDYRSVHLFVSLVAATVAGAALAGVALPARFATRRASCALRAIHAGAALVAAAAVVVQPPQAVVLQMFRVEGAVIAPLVARLRDTGSARGVIDPVAAPWFVDRAAAPAVPPSSPRILPAGSIVLLVTVDSMRASLFSSAEIAAKLPRLAELRARSVEFMNARSPGSRTLPVFAMVFTGKYYSQLEWHNVDVSRDGSVRFGELLSQAGIPTVNVVSCGQLGGRNLKGGFTEEIVVPAPAGQTYALSTDVIPRLVARLEQHGEGPLFVFAHMMDPHFPYDAGGRKGTPFERYLREVALADRSIGQLWEALEARGLLDRTALFVSADHGEAFGQHGTTYHTVTLYEELIRVPLFVRLPGVAPRRVDRPVSLMDLGPTILDLFGLPTPGHFMGQSLTPYFRGRDPLLTRPIAAERVTTRALVMGSRKLVADSQKGSLEIYDLATDPDETRNLFDELGKRGHDEMAVLRAFFAARPAGR